jgi:hypothetical protein
MDDSYAFYKSAITSIAWSRLLLEPSSYPQHYWWSLIFREEIGVSEHHHSHDHDHTEPPSDLVLRVQALESLLIEKGLVESATIDALIDTYETKVGPRNGANVVARAWGDPEFKDWLLRDATAAIASLGYTGRQGEQRVMSWAAPG